MPVYIVKKSKTVDDTDELVEPVPLGQRPVLKKPKKVGEFVILPDCDAKEAPGKSMFLIHLFKPYWFALVTLDSKAGTLKMRSPAGTVFDGTINGAVSRNYMVVEGPEGIATPSEAVINTVRAFIKPQ